MLTMVTPRRASQELAYLLMTPEYRARLYLSASDIRKDEGSVLMPACLKVFITQVLVCYNKENDVTQRVTLPGFFTDLRTTLAHDHHKAVLRRTLATLRSENADIDPQAAATVDNMPEGDDEPEDLPPSEDGDDDEGRPANRQELEQVPETDSEGRSETSEDDANDPAFAPP